MAQYGGPKNAPWSRAPQAAPGTIEPPGLLSFGSGPNPQSVFQQGPPNVHPGLAGMGPLGGQPPPGSLGAGQQYQRQLNVGAYPLGSHQQILQQQQQAVALQQQQQQNQNMMGGQAPQSPFANLDFNRLQGLTQQPPPGQPNSPANSSPAQVGGNTPGHRVFTGTVTKLHENFGFVDEDVFFQTSVVKGQLPQVKDRVLVEAAYNANMPFKWNATRIQVLPNQRTGGPGPGGPPPNLSSSNTLNPQVFNSPAGVGLLQKQLNVPPPPPPRGGGNLNDQFAGNRDLFAQPRGLGNMNMQNNSLGGPGPMSGKGDKLDRGGQRRGGNFRDDRRMDRPPRIRGSSPAMGHKRSRSPVRRTRSKSPVRSTHSRSRSPRSPPRRRARTAPRYNVSVPKVSLHFPESNVHALKQRYSHMYIPSDFFMANHVWTQTFPVHSPFKIQSHSSFHILNKDLVENPIKNSAILDPPDADHSLNVKVMLLATPPLDDFYEKTCRMAGDNSHSRDHLVHPTRVFHFLVGTRGKNETMAIGGPWSPSLDGPNPFSNPAVLVRTAIRTCKALTGIDLSNCTQWHKFLEVNYRRLETSSKPARTETTVLFLPDVWSVMPNANEFTLVKTIYSHTLDCKLNPELFAPDQEEEEEENSKEENSRKIDEEKESKMDETDPDDIEKDIDDGVEDDDDSNRAPKSGPSHWSELDPKTMKVQELRDEINARSLNSKGLKTQLICRLQKAIKFEQEKEVAEARVKALEELIMAQEQAKLAEENAEKVSESDDKKVDEEKAAADEAKKDEKKDAMNAAMNEKRIAALKAAFKIPQNPCILVHPNPKYKSGKFDCAVMSLSLLLDYRTEDNKEGTFEVSLFAELFNEMLMRDSGFRLYKTIATGPPIVQPSTSIKKDEKEKSSEPEPEKTERAERTGRDEKDENGKEEKKEKRDKDEKKEKEEEKEKEKAKKAAEKKSVTVDKDLLLACSYFDLNHSGYFESKDLEELFVTLDLNLSRSHIKKLISKIAGSTKDVQVNYRHYTDKFEDDESISKPMTSKVDENDEKLGLGFKAFLKAGQEDEDMEDVNTEGIYNYKGSVVDIGKLLAQLSRSERGRSEIETQLSESNKSLTELKELSERLSQSKEKLQSDLKDLKKKLKSAEEGGDKYMSENRLYLTTLKEIKAKITAAIADENPPAPKVKVEVKEQSPEVASDEKPTSVNGNGDTEDIKTK